MDSENKLFYLLIGTYTSTPDSYGLFLYEFNCETGDCNFKSKLAGIENPSYIAVSHNGKNVYLVNEVTNGGISSFAFNLRTGELSFINRVSSGGSEPCYITTDIHNRYVFACNCESGNIAAVCLNKDGSLGQNIQIIRNEDTNIDSNIRLFPHAHCTMLSPDNHFLFVSDLGVDKVYIYHFDPSNESQPLTPIEPPFVVVPPGSGPRHLVIHPSFKFVYLIMEMGGYIMGYDYQNGKIIEKQSITMLSSDFKGNISAADIHISSDGRFLYASNRGDANELVIYTIDKNGILSFKDRQPTLGFAPRNFAIDPSGNFLLVANQKSNEIIIFRRCRKSGLLTSSGMKIIVSQPVCLKFCRIQ
jgi:6-phosphogluconolactonase